MPDRLTDDQIAQIRALATTLNQRELARRFGVSQPTISRLIRGFTGDSRPLDPADVQGIRGDPRAGFALLGPEDLPEDDDPAEEEVPDDPPAAPVSVLEDLARRVEDLDRTARRAEAVRQFGAATAARKLAAKLSRELAQLREEEAAKKVRARTDEPDAELAAELAALVSELPDLAFELLEAAVLRRRRVAVEADRDGR